MSSYISPNAPHNLIWQVVWDGASDSDSEDGVEVELPNEYQFVPETVPSDDVADYLSDKTGWCVSELYLCGCGLSKWVLDVAAVSRLKEENEKLKDFSNWENHPALKHKVVLDDDFYLQHLHEGELIDPDDYKELKEEVNTLKIQQEQLEGMGGVMAREGLNAISENHKLKEENKKLKEENKATDPLLEKLAENVANQRFTKEIKKLEEQYSKAVQDINQRDLERTSHLKEIKELKEEVGGLEAKNDRLDTRNEDFGKEIKELKEKLKLNVDKVSELTYNTLAGLKEENEELREANETYEDLLAGEKGLIDENKKLKDQFEKLQVEANRLHSENQKLKQK